MTDTSLIRNAIIKSTHLGQIHHCEFTASIQLDYGSSGQSWGEHNLQYSKYGVKYLMRILEIVGVEKWEDLLGKHVRVKLDSPYGCIEAIGNILKDEWFDPKKDFGGN